MDIESIIKFENESSYVDFKKTQYHTNNKDELLKDIMSMANANIENRIRYIIIGVKHLPSGEREIHPLSENEFIDDANYQELVRSNIEPEIQFTYKQVYYENKLLGVFEITGCNNRPYILKKKTSKLEQGACYIRRGSQNGRAIREDFEGMYDERYTKRREMEIKNSYLHLLKHEFINSSLVLWRINTYISKGPIIKEIWDPADRLSEHLVFEAWDSLLRSGVIASLEFEEMENYRYAVTTMRIAIYSVQEAKANWLRILEWNNPIVESDSVINELKQSPSPHSVMEQNIRNCKEAIDTAQKAIQLAVKNLETKHQI